MSGRLAILPKKSYCPWNPQNVERVLRDERLERERQDHEKKAQQRAESQQRWDLLKQQKEDGYTSTIGQTNNEDNAPPMHINLFEKEEQEFCQETTGISLSPQHKKPKNVGIMPVFLGESLDHSQAKKDAQEAKMQSQSYRQKQERRKYDMDPMKAFVEQPQSVLLSSASSKCCDTDPTATKEKALANGHVFWNPQGSGNEMKPPQQAKKKRRKSKQDRPKRKRHAGANNNSDSDSESDTSSSNCNNQRKRKRHEHKHHRKPKRRRSQSTSGSSKGESSSMVVGVNMDELRKRRLEREQREKLREQAIIQESMGLGYR